MRNKPKIIKKEVVAESRYFQVESLHLEFSNGAQLVYECLKETGYRSVMIVAVQAGHVVLVREYAVGVHDKVLGLPKGCVDEGETFMEAANRELAEEIGLAAQRLTELGELTLAPGHLCHKSMVILAEDLYPCQIEGDEPEPLEVVRVPLDQIGSLVASGELNEARAIAALYMADQHLNAAQGEDKHPVMAELINERMAES